MCEDVSLCHWPPQGLHNECTEKSWWQRWRLTMGPQPVLPYQGRKLLLLLDVLSTGNKNQCRVPSRHHAFKRPSGHLLASWLGWTPAICEKAMFHPDKDWQGRTYGFAFLAYSSSASTTIQGLTECLVDAWTPTQCLLWTKHLCPPKVVCWSLIQKVMVFGSGAFGNYVMKVGSSQMWLVTL